MESSRATRLVLRWLGSILTFVGTFLALAGINHLIFSIAGSWNPTPLMPDADVVAIDAAHLSFIRWALMSAVVGVGLYAVGRHLRPGALSQIGMMLFGVAILWALSAGACYYNQVDHLGLQRGLIDLGSFVGAFVGAIGQLLLRPSEGEWTNDRPPL